MMEDYLDMENNHANPKPYRINIGDTIKVNRQDITYKNKNYTFYSTTVSIRSIQGETIPYKKEINFKLGVELQDGTYIKINNMRENARMNKKDRYEPIWLLCIYDFDIVPVQDIPDEMESLKEYRKQIENSKAEDSKIEDSKIEVDVGF